MHSCRSARASILGKHPMIVRSTADRVSRTKLNQEVTNQSKTRTARAVHLHFIRDAPQHFTPDPLFKALTPCVFSFQTFCSRHLHPVVLQTWKTKSCHSPLPYGSHSLPQAPFLPCVSSQFTVFTCMDTSLCLALRDDCSDSIFPIHL